MVTHAIGGATRHATTPEPGLVARARQALADQRAGEEREERQRLAIARDDAVRLMQGALVERFGVSRDSAEVVVSDQPNASGRPVIVTTASVDGLLLVAAVEAGQVLRLSRNATCYSEVDVRRPCDVCGEPIFLGRANGLLALGHCIERVAGCARCHADTVMKGA